MSKPPKRKYVSIEVAQKLKALEDLKNGIPVTTIAQVLGVSAKTVNSWEKNREKFQDWEKVFTGNLPTKVKRLKKPENYKVDQATWIWYKERKSAGLPLDSSTIRTQARWFWNTLGGSPGFDASAGWLARWKIRHGLQPCSSTASSNPSSKKAPDDDHLQESTQVFKEILEGIIATENLSPHQIFNCDKISFNYKQLPKNALSQLNDSSFKVHWERMTVMACSNASGSFKLPLMIIGNAKDPIPLRGIRHIPVSYKSQRTSSLTSNIFLQWFKEEFEPLVKFYLIQAGLPMKAVLTMNDCGGHTNNLESDFIRVEALEEDFAGVRQPLGHGCLQELKMRYRRKLMAHVVGHFNTGAVLLEAVDNVTLREVVFWMRDSWRELASSTIVKCWEKLWPGISKCPGVIGDLSKYTENVDCDDKKFHEVYVNEVDLVKDQFLFALQKVNDEIEIADVDQWLNPNLHLSEDECLSDNDIVVLVNDQEAEKNNPQPELPEVTLPEAMSSLDKVIRHCEKGNSYRPDHVAVLREIQEAMKLKEKQSIQPISQNRPNFENSGGSDLIQSYLAAFHES